MENRVVRPDFGPDFRKTAFSCEIGWKIGWKIGWVTRRFGRRALTLVRKTRPALDTSVPYAPVD